jgi:polyisoprenoid-binding protein YceI
MATTNTADNAVRIPRTGRYEIDTQGSIVAFKGRHLFGLAPVGGTFAIRHGVIDVADPIADSTVHVDIDATSFHTGNGQRDSDVRSARFLDAGRYPSMRFSSQRLEGPGGGSTLTGTLTVRDVARPVSLVIEQCTVQPASPGLLVVRASTRIDRTDFGLTAARGMAGRHLDVSLRILAVRR